MTTALTQKQANSGQMSVANTTLREAEYAQLPVELKARALQALCERALNVFHAHIDESGEELGPGEMGSVALQLPLPLLQVLRSREVNGLRRLSACNPSP